MRFSAFGVIRTMNILIVGNGFDLSHYLPTKYDHFMDVMRAIEDKNTGGKVPDLTIHTVQEWMDILDEMFFKRNDPNSFKFEMNFDELFLKTRDSNFIGQTKKYYLTDNIVLSAQDVIKIQYRLSLNCWYQYFKNHVEEIKTWIDFEQKIESALTLVFKYTSKIDAKFEKYGKIENYIKLLTKSNSEKDDNLFYISELDFKLLAKLKLCIENNDFGKTKNYGGFGAMPDNRKGFINSNWFHVQDKTEYGFAAEKYISFLNKQLEEFIEIFNLYIDLVVDELKTTNSFIIDSENWQKPEKIFSFNYTNTYQRIHDNVEVDFLHGSSGENQNIVLGVSDLKDESLKTLKAYGFTKYHQKLFKDTQYLFLDKFKKKIQQDKKDIEELKRKVMMPLQPTFVKSFQSQLNEKMNSQCLDLNFYIWGHSLDYSDKDYILDLFSLNDDMDRNVSVIVYYFDQNAKFVLLNNLLAILEKDKVEEWMKNKWLQFKPNPEIQFGEIVLEKTA